MRISDWSSDVCSSDLSSQRSVVTVVGIEGFGGRGRGDEGSVAPVDAGEAGFVLRAVGRTAPRRLGREVEVALPHGLAVAVRAAFEVLTVLPHGHGSVLRPGRQRQPTLPSIWSSMRRLHSTAYSMGSVRVRSAEHKSELQSILRSSNDVFCL